MNTLARICWVAAPVYVLIGMCFGMWMSSIQDFQFAPAHAHLNLLGWVTVALYGTFYALKPEASTWMISKAQVAAANLGVILMFPGIMLAIKQVTEALVVVGSLLAVIAVVLFLVIVVRATGSTRQTA